MVKSVSLFFVMSLMSSVAFSSTTQCPTFDGQWNCSASGFIVRVTTRITDTAATYNFSYSDGSTSEQVIASDQGQTDANGFTVVCNNNSFYHDLGNGNYDSRNLLDAHGDYIVQDSSTPAKTEVLCTPL